MSITWLIFKYFTLNGLGQHIYYRAEMHPSVLWLYTKRLAVPTRNITTLPHYAYCFTLFTIVVIGRMGPVFNIVIYSCVDSNNSVLMYSQFHREWHNFGDICDSWDSGRSFQSCWCLLWCTQGVVLWVVLERSPFTTVESASTNEKKTVSKRLVNLKKHRNPWKKGQSEGV